MTERQNKNKYWLGRDIATVNIRHARKRQPSILAVERTADGDKDFDERKKETAYRVARNITNLRAGTGFVYMGPGSWEGVGQEGHQIWLGEGGVLMVTHSDVGLAPHKAGAEI